MKPTFSVVFPFRADHGERDRLFEWNKARWQTLCPDAELIVGEDDTDGLFNRSRAVNNGVRQCSTPYVFITDGDVLCDRDQVMRAIGKLKQGAPWVSPFTHTVHLHEQKSLQILAGDVAAPVAPTEADLDYTLGQGIWDHTTNYGVACHQCALLVKDFWAINGFDETFKGWGFEDGAFATAANTLLGLQEKVPHRLVHLFHKYAGNKAAHEHPFYDVNKRRYERYIEASGAPSKMRQVVGLAGTIHLLACDRHYAEHLLPIWRALPPRHRGLCLLHEDCRGLAAGDGVYFYGSDMEAGQLLNNIKGPVMVSSVTDMRMVARRQLPVVLAQHGAGQSYGTGHASYPGGDERPGVVLELHPNEQSAAKARQRHPNIPTAVVGCPKLDTWAGFVKERGPRPVVAISFHPDVMICPESRSAWNHYKNHLRLLLDQGWDIIGHAHPYMQSTVAPWYAELGIPLVTSFNEVMHRADLYVCDNSSTIFEFAATDRPVVFLNAPWYRRSAWHGLRFWDAMAMGWPVYEPGDLPTVVRVALNEATNERDERRAVVNGIFPHFGKAADLAVKAILTTRTVWENPAMHKHDQVTIIMTAHTFQQGQMRQPGELFTTTYDDACRLIDQQKARWDTPEESLPEITAVQPEIAPEKAQVEAEAPKAPEPEIAPDNAPEITLSHVGDVVGGLLALAAIDAAKVE